MRELDARLYRPDPVLLRAPRTRPADGGVFEMERPDGSWEKVHAFCVAIIDGLVAGERLDGLVARAGATTSEHSPGQVDALTRYFVWKLVKLGYARVPLEEPPEIFAKRYRRIRELGRGGVGIVHLCEDQQRGGEVAVKHAWGWLENIQRCDAGVRREGEILRSLSPYPCVPKWRDEFEERDLAHVVRDAIDGPSLARFVRDLDEKAGTPLALARDVAQLCGHMHARGWLCLDMTPSNFIVRESGSACMVDVGLAHAWAGAPLTFRVPVGSRGYTAPEILGARVADPRSDVWGFGRLLYFVATRAAPQHGWNAEALSAALERSRAEPEVAQIVRDCCADEPAARPPIGDVLTRLAAIG